ncbi:hypothetical protein [Streptomyces sp. NPDC059957]|uniref:hypothetical protein n=1 Tax=Streptomyces sp. NPDC059957 TaxID=3347016 RepID=UPI0036550159
MNEDRKTNEDEGRDLPGLPEPSGESASGGPEALLALVLGKPGTAEPAEPATAEPAAAEPATTKPAAAKLAAVKPVASGPVDDEDALRDLLHGVVVRLEPSDDALERLRGGGGERRGRHHKSPPTPEKEEWGLSGARPDG